MTFPGPPVPALDPSRLRMAFQHVRDHVFEGYLLDPTQPLRRFSVEMRVDGLPVHTVLADLAISADLAEGQDDVFHGFAFVLPEEWRRPGAQIEAFVANMDLRIGETIILGKSGKSSLPLIAGEVRWEGGPELEGWCFDLNQFPLTVRDETGTAVDVVRGPSGWARFSPPSLGPRPGFRCSLPPAVADGSLRSLSVVDQAGRALAGSPLPIAWSQVSQAGGIDTQGDLSSAWRTAALKAPTESFASGSIGFVFAGEGSLEESIAALEALPSLNWIAAALPEDGGPGRFNQQACLAALEGDLRDCDLVFFAVAGARWTAHGIAALSRSLSDLPARSAICGDVTLGHADAADSLVSFPGFDFERCQRQGYPSLAFAVQRAEALERVREGASSLARLLLHRPFLHGNEITHQTVLACDLGTPDLARLQPTLREAVEAQFEARGVPATVQFASAEISPPALSIRRSQGPRRVSVICPISRDAPKAVVAFMRTAASALAPCDGEFVLVEAGKDRSVHTFHVAGVSVRQVLTNCPTANRAALLNAAVAEAQGEILVFLENSLHPAGATWTDEITGLLADPLIGAVGGVTVTGSGLLREAGLSYEGLFAPWPAGAGRMRDDPSEGGKFLVPHETAGLSHRGLAMTRDFFIELGGFDATRFPRHFFGADLAGRISKADRRLVVSPQWTLLVQETSVRAWDTETDAASFALEARRLRERQPDLWRRRTITAISENLASRTRGPIG